MIPAIFKHEDGDYIVTMATAPVPPISAVYGTQGDESATYIQLMFLTDLKDRSHLGCFTNSKNCFPDWAQKICSCKSMAAFVRASIIPAAVALTPSSDYRPQAHVNSSHLPW